MLVAIFAAIVYDVTVRTVGWQPPYWVSALTEYALLFVTMLAAPWLVRTRGHVFVESLLMILPGAVRAVLEKTVYLLCATICLVLCYYAVTMGLDAHMRGEFDVRSIDMPRWILFAALAVGFVLCAVEFLRYLAGVGDMYAGRGADHEGI